MPQSFFNLTPDLILDSVEAALDLKNNRATGRTWILNSIENRVYEIELEDETRLVGKFYRPSRWTPEQILEEHAFSAELARSEVPALSPLILPNAKWKTLAESSLGIYFSLFPKVQGRNRDELTLEEVQVLGRFIGRMHQVGAGFAVKTRNTLNVENYGWDSLDTLLSSNFMDANMKSRYEAVVQPLLDLVAYRLHGVPLQAIHGDCHIGNVMWHQGMPLLLDFDDMVLGPAVQDLWMIINGRELADVKMREALLEAYETFMPFDYSQLELIEALRALRLVHYSAWIARRWEDPSFPRIFPLFGTDTFWFEEIQALDECRNLLMTGNSF